MINTVSQCQLEDGQINLMEDIKTHQSLINMVDQSKINHKLISGVDLCHRINYSKMKFIPNLNGMIRRARDASVNIMIQLSWFMDQEMKSCFHQAIFLITESHKEGECQAQELIELIHHHHHGDKKQTSTGITLQDPCMVFHLIIMTTVQDLKIDLTHQTTHELFLQTRAIIEAPTINMEILMTSLKDLLLSKALINFKWTT